jgi:Kef-type K+ transport system membrane component KefB
MPELKLLFLQMAVVLIATRLVATAFRLIRQPEVLGEMTAGILLGPSLFGRIAPDLMNGLFPSSSMGPLYAVSQLGLVLFMFLVGLEVRPRLIRESARSVVLASQASIVAPFVCGGILALSLYTRLGNGTAKLPFVLFIGAAMGITAFPVLARILTDRKLMNTRVGMLAISCAAVDDVSAWCLLAVITVVARPEASQTALPLRFGTLGVYVLAMLFLLRPALRRLFPANEPPGPGRFAMVMILLLGSVWTTEALGVHALFGAFLAGVVMPRGEALESGLRGRIESITTVLLLPLFFAYTGLRTSLSLLNSLELWLVCGLITLVAIGSKLLVSAVSIRASGVSWRESLAVGVLVNTRGLVELVILNVGLDLHILSPTLFSMMVIMALTTTFMTSPLLDWIHPELTGKPSGGNLLSTQA